MDIITKEIITEPNKSIATIVALIAIGIMIAIMVCLYIRKNVDFAVKAMAWVFFIALPLILVGVLLGSTIFRTTTDRYKYTATLDETVSAVELYENYTNIEYRDGIWYFEDKEK